MEGFPVSGHSCLRKKGDVSEAPDNATTQRNSTYIQTVSRSIYKNRQ